MHHSQPMVREWSLIRSDDDDDSERQVNAMLPTESPRNQAPHI
jgi:hypothetical protein